MDVDIGHRVNWSMLTGWIDLVCDILDVGKLFWELGRTGVVGETTDNSGPGVAKFTETLSSVVTVDEIVVDDVIVDEDS